MSLKNWLHSQVEWRGAPIKRGQLFKHFLNDGLIPFIDSMGYHIGTPPNVFYGYIVAGLYENREKSTFNSKWNTSYFTNTWTEEDRLFYYDTIEPDHWTSFWDSWKSVEDFSEDSFRGRDRRIDIEDLSRRQIDIVNSYQTEVLYDMIYDEYEGETEDPSKKVDIYLIENAGWSGLRH